MGDQKRLSKERPHIAKGSVKLRLSFFLSLLCFGLAVVTLVPWGANIPNHLNYYSVCSFTPISTVMLLALGLGIRSYGRGQQRQLKASVVVLVMLVVFGGFWAYTVKMPISSLQLGIQVRGVYQIISLEANSTNAVLNLSIHNPTDIDTPAFEMESFDIVVNGTRMVPGTYDCFPSNDYNGMRYIFHGETVRAHQTNSYSDLILSVYWNWTEIEGGVLSTVLSALNQSRFSLTFSGLIVVRTSYITSPDSVPGLIVVAVPFKVSFTYP